MPLFSYFHRPSLLGATWELLLDPATWCFLVGGIVLIAWRRGNSSSSSPTPNAQSPIPNRPFLPFVQSLAWFLVPVLLWLPIRAGILLTIYLHDVVWMDLGPDWIEAAMLPMRLFWSTPVHLLLLAGPVLLAWRLVPRVSRRTPGSEEETARSNQKSAVRNPQSRVPHSYSRHAAAGLLTVAAVACLGAAIFWDPPGQPKKGRILIEDNRWLGNSIWDQTKPDKRWERTRTDKPYNTEWYGELSGYNYYCITEYARHYFEKIDAVPHGLQPDATEMDTVWPLTDALLADYDVLVIKIPGRPFADDEINAVERFVRNGGGLLMIGDHTNVYGHATYLNRIARRFGFSYRYDCLLGVDKPWEDHYDPPLVPHPIVQGLREMDFATSNSIDPGTSDGRGVMRAAGLKNLTPDYFAFNLQPTAEDRPQMRTGRSSSFGRRDAGGAGSRPSPTRPASPTSASSSRERRSCGWECSNGSTIAALGSTRAIRSWQSVWCSWSSGYGGRGDGAADGWPWWDAGCWVGCWPSALSDWPTARRCLP